MSTTSNTETLQLYDNHEYIIWEVPIEQLAEWCRGGMVEPCDDCEETCGMWYATSKKHELTLAAAFRAAEKLPPKDVLQDLLTEGRKLLLLYERTGDHKHHVLDSLTGPGDCVACAFRRALITAEQRGSVADVETP
jgi:hypothetical protein